MSVVTISVDHIQFAYRDQKNCFEDVSFVLSRGDRCILTGDNGVGKSTLLHILSGKSKVSAGSVAVLGKDPYFDTTVNSDLTIIESNWGRSTVAFSGYSQPLLSDIPVRDLMTDLQNKYPDRRDRLMKLLGIQPSWRMHKVSDGQRRRVQIFLGLLKPFKVLLLDEVTTDIDIVTRQDLLQYLTVEEQEATIIYATHIFDGLDDWFTHIIYLEEGRIGRMISKSVGIKGTILQNVESWIRETRKKHPYKEEEDGDINNVKDGYTPGRVRMENYY